MRLNTAEPATALARLEVVEAPSWYSATMMSASPLAATPSESWAATRFTAATGSPKSRPDTPVGVTMLGVSAVTAPMTPTVTPLTSWSAYSGRAGFVVPRS